MTVVGHRKRRQDQTAISPRQTASSSSDKRLGNHQKSGDLTVPPLPSPVVKRIRLILFADKEILEFAADGLSSPRNFDLTFALGRYQGKQSIR